MDAAITSRSCSCISKVWGGCFSRKGIYRHSVTFFRYSCCLLHLSFHNTNHSNHDLSWNTSIKLNITRPPWAFPVDSVPDVSGCCEVAHLYCYHTFVHQQCFRKTRAETMGFSTMKFMQKTPRDWKNACMFFPFSQGILSKKVRHLGLNLHKKRWRK